MMAPESVANTSAKLSICISNRQRVVNRVARKCALELCPVGVLGRAGERTEGNVHGHGKRCARIVSRRVKVFVAVSVTVESASAPVAILHSHVAVAAVFFEFWKTRDDYSEQGGNKENSRRCSCVFSRR
jgi:hypothetical protein